MCKRIRAMCGITSVVTPPRLLPFGRDLVPHFYAHNKLTIFQQQHATWGGNKGPACRSGKLTALLGPARIEQHNTKCLCSISIIVPRHPARTRPEFDFNIPEWSVRKAHTYARSSYPAGIGDSAECEFVVCLPSS